MVGLKIINTQRQWEHPATNRQVKRQGDFEWAKPEHACPRTTSIEHVIEDFGGKEYSPSVNEIHKP